MPWEKQSGFVENRVKPTEICTSNQLHITKYLNGYRPFHPSHPSHTIFLFSCISSSFRPPPWTSSENTELSHWDLETSQSPISLHANHVFELERLASISNSYKGIYHEGDACSSGVWPKAFKISLIINSWCHLVSVLSIHQWNHRGLPSHKRSSLNCKQKNHSLGSPVADLNYTIFIERKTFFLKSNYGNRSVRLSEFFSQETIHKRRVPLNM